MCGNRGFLYTVSQIDTNVLAELEEIEIEF